MKGIALNDENANGIFKELANNIWNHNMFYHLTTSVSAENIYNNGMAPSKKKTEVLEDIDFLASILFPENIDYFMPYALNDKGTYSFGVKDIPTLQVRLNI